MASTTSTTVKIPKEAHATLTELAETRKQPMSRVLADLIERERRRQFFEEYDAAIERLKADPEAFADYWAEHRSMDGTLMDGLENDPWIE